MDAAISTTTFTKLQVFCKEGRTQDVETLLTKNPELLGGRDGAGNSPLYVAIKQRNVDLAQRLVQLGADVNAVNNVSSRRV